MRIVSLIASATEIVAALGAREHLVGRSHECDVPESVETLPALTRARFDTGMSSKCIDTSVKNLVNSGLSVYDIDQDTLKALSPNVIVTQDQCEVCAASLDDVEAAVCEWVGQNVRIVSLHPDTVSDIMSDIGKVGEAIGRKSEADALVASLTSRLGLVSENSRRAEQTRPTVFILEWIDPLMGAGHWIPELVESADGRNLVTRAGAPSPYVTWANIEDADPDFIIVAPCGFDLERTEKEMSAIKDCPEWQGLRAVQTNKVAIMDGNRFVNRPSPSVVESTAMIRDIIHIGRPELGPPEWRWFNV